MLKGTNSVANTLSSSTLFTIEIIPNYPPTIVPNYDSAYTMYAWHSWTFTFQYNSDPEIDTPYMDAMLLDSTMTTITPAWFTRTVAAN